MKVDALPKSDGAEPAQPRPSILIMPCVAVAIGTVAGVTGMALVMSFIRVDHDFPVPVIFEFGGTLMARRWMRR